MDGISPRIGLQILFLLILTTTAHAIYVFSTPHDVVYAPIVSITDEDAIDTTLSEVSKVVRITADSSNSNSTIVRFSLYACDGRNSRNTQIIDFNISACFFHPTQFGDYYDSYHCGDALPYSFNSIENFSNGNWSYFELKIPDDRRNDTFGKIQVTLTYKLKNAVSKTLSSIHYYWYGFQCYNENCPSDGSNGLRKNILFLQNDDWNIEYSSPNSNVSLDPLVYKNNLFILSTNRYFYSDHVSYTRPVETAVNVPLTWAFIGAILGALIAALLIDPVYELVRLCINSSLPKWLIYVFAIVFTFIFSWMLTKNITTILSTNDVIIFLSVSAFAFVFIQYIILSVKNGLKKKAKTNTTKKNKKK